MKKILLVAIMAMGFVAAGAFQKAIYVKKGDSYAKYNFGVAGDLMFSNGGRTLTVSGYEESIDLDKIDFITFSAPVDQTGLTPTASKERLIQIGEELDSKIDANDQSDLIRMLDIFLRRYCDYYLDSKYYDVHTSLSDDIKGLAEGISDAAKGDLSGIRRARQKGVSLYSISDYFGVFRADDRKHEWEKIANADYLELRFTAPDGVSQYKLRLTQSEEYTDWTEVDFVGRVPKVINVEATFEGSKILGIAIKSDIDNDAKSADIDMTVDLQKGYIVTNDMSITNTMITDHVNLSNGNGVLMTAQAVVHGVELTNYDKWKEDFDNTHGADSYYDDFGEWIVVDDTRAEMLAGHVTYATSEVDVLGKLQVKGRVSAISKLHDILGKRSYLDKPIKQWDEATGTLTTIWDDKEVVDNAVLHLNNYPDISFYYDGKPAVQGYISWDCDEDLDDRWYDEDWQWDDEKGDYIQVNPHWVQYIYYGEMPLLVFPDLTTFAVEDYFNEKNFATLVNDYNAILDTYYAISGNKKENDEY